MLSYAAMDALLYARLEAKSIPEPNTGCWLWMGAANPRGYGNVWVDGVSTTAHRAMLIAIHGPVAREMDACHKCDTPACINPEHLFLGTRQTNMADMRAKGRAGYTGLLGQANHKARLTEDVIRAIRSAYAAGEGTRALAERHAITMTHVRHIVAGKAWRHVN